MSSSTPAGTQPTPNPPRNDPITTKELSLHNGQDPSKPIWVAVKGTVFDVSRNKDRLWYIPRHLRSREPRILSVYRGPVYSFANF